MDFNLYQAIREARPIASDRDGEAWDRLRGLLDDVFGALSLDVGDVAYDRDADRLDRTRLHEAPREAVTDPSEVDSEAQEQVIAALHALHDRPSEQTATAAADALDALRSGMGR